MLRMHRGARVLGVLVALSLTVAACGDDDKKDDTGTKPDTSTQSDHLAIGTLFPESGSLQGIVKALSSPVGLAVDEINAAGGVLGKDVTIASADDGTDDATLAGASLTRLVSSDGIRALMGPASSTLSEKLMKQIKDADVVACSGSNTAASLEDLDDGGRYFGFAPNDNLQGPALAQVISDDGHSKIAILARNDTYGTGFAKAVDTALKDAGAQVVLNAVYDPASTLGYKADVDKVVAAKPDAVVVLGFGDDGA
jgi:branched-chain amino acid transport system substrate-binding protein